MLNVMKNKCTSKLADGASPEDLLSVYLAFREAKEVDGSAEASTTLISAYQRAFGCGSAG
jgi:hypothetical protein